MDADMTDAVSASASGSTTGGRKDPNMNRVGEGSKDNASDSSGGRRTGMTLDEQSILKQSQDLFRMGALRGWNRFPRERYIFLRDFARSQPKIMQPIWRLLDRVLGHGMMIHEGNPMFSDKAKQDAFQEFMKTHFVIKFLKPVFESLLQIGIAFCTYVPHPEFEAQAVMIDIETVDIYYRCNCFNVIEWRIMPRNTLGLDSINNMLSAEMMNIGAINDKAPPHNSYDRKNQLNEGDFQFQHPTEPIVLIHGRLNTTTGTIDTPLTSLVDSLRFGVLVKAEYLKILARHSNPTVFVGKKPEKPISNKSEIHGAEAGRALVPDCDQLSQLAPYELDVMRRRIEASNFTQGIVALRNSGVSTTELERKHNGGKDGGGGGSGPPGGTVSQVKLQDDEKVERPLELGTLPDFVTLDQQLGEMAAAAYGVSVALTSKSSVGKSLISGGATKTTDAPMEMFRSTSFQYATTLSLCTTQVLNAMFHARRKRQRELDEFLTKQEQRADLINHGGTPPIEPERAFNDNDASRPAKRARVGTGDGAEEEGEEGGGGTKDKRLVGSDDITVAFAGVVSMEHIEKLFQMGRLDNDMFREYMSALTGVPLSHILKEPVKPAGTDVAMDVAADYEEQTKRGAEIGKLSGQKHMGIDINAGPKSKGTKRKS